MTLENIKVDKGSIKAQLIEDAQDAESAVQYIKEVAENGCIGGNCVGLLYTADCEEFYTKHANEVDVMLEDMEQEIGDTYDITANMKRLGLSNLREFLAWLAYEVRAQEIMRELELENY